MKNIKWQIVFGLFLVALSAAVYFLHFLSFHDAHHIFIYLLGDIAFVPIEVLLVTLIIHNLLSIREKRTMLRKLNMVIGTFFSDAGTSLAERFFGMDKYAERIGLQLAVESDWNDKEFNSAKAALRCHSYEIDIDAGDLEELKKFLLSKRKFLMRLLENPNLLEHDEFTDMLWAIFHLTEELLNRQQLDNLSQTDLNHLSGDVERAYKALIFEWVEYMEHLKNQYPYLFSLAMRTNPFNPNSSVYVT